jgi:ABC-type glycerol-3-phosphate transport system substrate-binding protein
LWSFSPFPGVEKSDGTIDNRVVPTTSQTSILAEAKRRGRLDEAWKFVRWWMSTEVQTEYGQGIEAALGTSARYATANPDVLLQLPWAAADAKKLLEQFKEGVGIPVVPGNYMTTRMVDYAFNNVVTGSANARETLFLNVQDINSELTKKRKEFGFSYMGDKNHPENTAKEAKAK